MSFLRCVFLFVFARLEFDKNASFTCAEVLTHLQRLVCGVPRAKAQLYAEKTILGTAAYLLETGMHPATLKDAVCSPGGTTIAGVEALEAGAFRAAASSAVTAAFEKTKKL